MARGVLAWRTLGEEPARRTPAGGARLTVHHLHILCEGQTEDIIVRDAIEPHFASADSYVTWSIFTTKRPAGGSTFKGGLSNWPKLLRELQLLLHDRSTTVLTTMFDYYAFPADAPGMADRPYGSPYDRVRHVESALATLPLTSETYVCFREV